MIDLRNLRAVVATTALFAMGACSELEVVNPNEPERDRALASAADVESLISGQFRSYWSLSQGNGDTNGSAASALDAFAGAIVSSSANNSTQYAGDLPPAAMPNVKGDRWARGFRDPWLVQNRALAAIRSGLQAKEDLGLVIEDPARLDAFAKLMQGLFHGQIALLYDRGFVIDETVDDVAALTLLPYDQVMTAARGYLAEARTIARANSFNTPQGWLGPASYTSDDLVELAHSYEARFMAQIARTPAERAAVNWAEVITHVNSGVTEDFGVELDGPGGIWGSSYKGQSGTGMSVGLTFLGPADQSGAYIAWENTPALDRTAFDIDTDDRRITDGTPQGPGAYTVWRNFFNNQPERGTYYLSKYAGHWFFDIGETGFGFAADISLQEQAFLVAEANIRLGNPAAALAMINDLRVSLGQLPPATVAGVSGARCVPRAIGPLTKASGLAEGACGDLLTTLIYEKRLTVFQLSVGSVFYDARGFGTLRTGRALHFAIPAEDLQILQIPIYSFGGGGEGSAN